MAWQGQLIAVHSPFWHRVAGREALITPQQYRLVARVVPGWRGNQRQLAASLGYSLGGLNDAIGTLTKLGILARLTQRGRHGWTHLVMVTGVRIGNVRERSTDVLRTLSERLSMYRTFPGGGADDRPMAAQTRGDGRGLRPGSLEYAGRTGLPWRDHRQTVQA